MIAPIIAVVSSFIDQLGSALIKKTENEPVYAASVWESAFLALTSGSLIIFAYVFVKSDLQLNHEKLWLFIPRIALEMLQIYVTFTALKIAELSSFNFLRVFSILFVVFTEMLLLRTVLTYAQYLGVFLVFISILFVFRHGVKNILSWKFLVVSAVNGGLLNVLAKYQFSFNNAYLNEAIVRVFLIAILFLLMRHQFTNHGFNHMKTVITHNKAFLLLVPIRAVVGMLNIFALNLGAAAIYSTAERAGSVLSGVVLGHAVFKEKSFTEKLLIALGISTGLGLLILG